MVKKSIGRPLKVDYKTIHKLADAIQNCASITEACKYAGISRKTFYSYLNNEPVFEQKIAIARQGKRNKALTLVTKR